MAIQRNLGTAQNLAGSSADMFKSEVSTTVTAGTGDVTVPFVDDATGNPFDSEGIILENFEGASALYYSFDGGTVFHRLPVNRWITFDNKTHSSVVLRSAKAAAHAFNLHAWGQLS